jgi:Leucine-rich repeat (LRR) protein
MMSVNLANNHLSKEEGTSISPPRQGLQKGDVVDGKTVTTIYDNGNIRVTDLSGILAIVNAIKDMRALSSANLLGNSIPTEQAQELVKIMRSKENLTTLCGLSREETELEFSGQDLGAGDAVLITNDISNMGALTSLDISNNKLGELLLPEGWTKKHAQSQEEYDAHAQANAWYEHVDGRWQKEDPSMPLGVITLATAIKDMRAITKFDISSNHLWVEGGKVLAAGLKGNQVITELNISSNRLGQEDFYSDYGDDTSGVIAIADAIPDMRAMTSLNLASNDLRIEGAKIVAVVLPKCM